MDITLVHESTLSAKKAIDEALVLIRRGYDPTGYLELAHQCLDQVIDDTAEEYTARPLHTVAGDCGPFLCLCRN